MIARYLALCLALLGSLTPHAACAFEFCVSTAAHQIEGQNQNSDWWNWERIPGKIKNGHTSTFATRSFEFMDVDVQNLKSLGVSVYRFSIEWAKVEPLPGQWNLDVLKQYETLIQKLKLAGIEPMVTLYHFTLPQWVAAQGGWDWPELPTAIERYTQKVAHFFSKSHRAKIKLWNTINEPITLIAAGYLSDVFPPGKKDLKSFARPMLHLVQAHAKMYRALHAQFPTLGIQVGIAHHLRVFDPKRKWHPLDWIFAHKFEEIANWAIPRAIATGKFEVNLPGLVSLSADVPEALNTQDFVGINYYSRDLISVHPFSAEPLKRSVPEGAPLTDLGWEIYPKGLVEVVSKTVKLHPGLPVWITEIGIADRLDQNRIPFLRAHLEELLQHRNWPIRGLCHWTLNDNFEWAEGYTAQFGLFATDLTTGKRTPKPSAKEFPKLIQWFKENRGSAQ